MSRLEVIAQAVEEGKPVDYGRELTLQALDCAIAGERFVADMLTRQRESDEQLET